jgi:cyclopropane fatty-acyl-phospholipid synthase-like methyltransferase
VAADQQIRDCFSERYRAAQSDVTRTIERAVIGGDWGANGFTTMAEADELGRSLALAPGTRLLDLGAGRGWPSLYLAASTGCTAVLIDPPIEGLAAAIARADEERLSGRTAAVVASARSLPVRRGTFDAVVHTDVVCCIRPKHAALRACRMALRPRGRMAFTVIEATPGLSPAGRRRASRDGPMAVLTASSYPALLAAAGFVDVTASDRTDAFASVATAWLEQRERHRTALEALLGADTVRLRQASSAAQLQAVHDGVLRRTLYEAVRPG